MRGTVRARGRSWQAGVLALAAVLASCGGGADRQFAVRDVNVVVRSEEPFTRAGDFPARVESTVEAALAYWGGSWDRLAGRSITFEGSQTVACGPHQGAFGCYDGDIRLSTRDIAFPFNCVEQTVLVHEVGHAVIGDGDHLDPRWMDFSPVMERLQGRQGYDAAGQVDCPLYVSVWRHPPDAPPSSVASVH